MAKKVRTTIPADIAAKALFLSDRTCCVCREHGRPVTIHHIDDDPSNGDIENLAILCLDCHRDTQLRGGFDRKLDAYQIRLYRDRWQDVVEQKWQAELILPVREPPLLQIRKPGVVQIHIQDKPAYLGFFQLSEKDENYLYSFQADYPQLMPDDSTVAFETNLAINALMTRCLQRFRTIDAFSTLDTKREMRKDPLYRSRAWDSMSVSYKLGLFTDRLLTLEFVVWSYFAGAAHPNAQTKTLNFLLHPGSAPLEFYDLFLWHSAYLDVVSRFCAPLLHKAVWNERSNYPETVDDWIAKGAGPQSKNFEKFLLEEGGIRVFFDAYEVACYAAGRQEVFIPKHALKGILNESIEGLL
jgi:hypothetical protein